MKFFNYSTWIKILFLSFALSFIACEEIKDEETQDAIATILGLNNNDNLSEMPQDINLGNNMASGTLPASADISAKFPPIGNQGQYGTCVAWACGYNLRGFLLKNDYPSKDLTKPENQFSAKDLFWAIPNSKKGSDCNGTNFESALDVLVSRGIADMATVPYSSLGNCSSSPSGDWTTNANKYKIQNYRKIDHTKVDVLKDYLSKGKAIVFGAKLGDKFMSWAGSNAISYDTYNNPGMQHAYHAMILCGYDNNKGNNGAFRVVNSWGKNWGDNGYIWVDEKFFTGQSGEFAFCAFVATTPQANPDEDGDNNVDPNNQTDGNDLVAWELTDGQNENIPNNPLKRSCKYNVFNAGTNTIPASKKWNILYLLYNAYDANNYEVLFYDYYTDEYGNASIEGNESNWTSYGQTACNNGDFSWVNNTTGVGNVNWWNNVNVAAGKSVAQALYFQTGDQNTRFSLNYTMPTKTGKYYLVLIADGYDVITEANEANNYMYFTGPNGDPLDLNNGIIQNLPTAKTGLSKYVTAPKYKEASPNPTAVSSRRVNTYKPFEIKKMIKTHAQNGELQKRVNKYLKTRNKDDKKVAF